MSFDIGNIGDRHLIQKSQNLAKDGGGGNLGYFQGRRKKQDDDENTSIFDEELEDEFVLSKDAMDSYKKFIAEENNSKNDSFFNKSINFLENLLS